MSPITGNGIPGLPPGVPLSKNQAKKLRKKVAADAAKKELLENGEFGKNLRTPSSGKNRNSLLFGSSEYIFSDDDYDTADDENSSGNVSNFVSKFEAKSKSLKRNFSPEEKIANRSNKSRIDSVFK